MVDWFAFVGGISVLCFLFGKTINHIFMRDAHIGPMMEKLFEVQDVSKLNNIRLDKYNNKAINEITNPYNPFNRKPKPPPLITPKVKPVDEESKDEMEEIQT